MTYVCHTLRLPSGFVPIDAASHRTFIGGHLRRDRRVTRQVHPVRHACCRKCPCPCFCPSSTSRPYAAASPVWACRKASVLCCRFVSTVPMIPARRRKGSRQVAAESVSVASRRQLSLSSFSDHIAKWKLIAKRDEGMGKNRQTPIPCAARSASSARRPGFSIRRLVLGRGGKRQGCPCGPDRPAWQDRVSR